MTSGRWKPTPEQIALAIDCAVARMPITRAAGLVGVGPRTLWLFAKRVGLSGIFGAWRDQPRYVLPVSSGSGGSRTAETAASAPL
jgi:hypothetical protein